MIKKVLFLLIVSLPLLSFAQRNYDIVGISVNTTMQNLIPASKIIKVKMNIIISDSVYNTVYEGKKSSFKIVKKINDNYFVIDDGIKTSTITIGTLKSKKYSGFINQESEKAIVILYFK